MISLGATVWFVYVVYHSISSGQVYRGKEGIEGLHNYPAREHTYEELPYVYKGKIVTGGQA